MNVSATAKKVLHIGKYFPPHVGGMETYLHNLMHALAALNIISCALVHQSSGTQVVLQGRSGRGRHRRPVPC